MKKAAKKKQGSGKPKRVAKKSPSLTQNKDPRPLKVPRGPSSGSKHARGVCAVTDPFCPAAKNSKWPDGTCGNTMTEQFRGNVTVSTLAAGNYGITFSPTAPYGYIGSASTTATTWTTGAALNLYKPTSMLATYAQEYRVVSFGVIARSVASATTSSGLVTFGTSGNLPALSTAFTFGTELYDEVAVVALQPGMEFSWISQPRGTDAHAFKTLSTSTAGSIDWTVLNVEIVGAAASTPVINFEWFMNVEFTLGVNSSIAGLARQNPPAVPHAATAVSHVHNTLGSFVQGGVAAVEDAVMKSATKALTSIASDPFASLASLAALF